MIGKILWWSDRDQNGIIVSDGKEYYFDRSVVRDSFPLKSGQFVLFDHNPRVTECLCATNISQPVSFI